MELVPALVALLTAAAGWHYLFYSQAATRLAEFEAEAVNLRRQRLRRVGGAVMLLLGLAIYAGLTVADETRGPRVFVIVWLVVFGLIALLVLLALWDIRLTHALRRQALQSVAKRTGGTNETSRRTDSADSAASGQAALPDPPKSETTHTDDATPGDAIDREPPK
jgi:hypothetical protein